jgi:hypothetical protein
MSDRDDLIAKARTWERDWGERRTSGLITALADLAESEGRRADEAEAERSKSDGAYEALFKRSSNSINTMRTERDAALAELAALKGQQP